MNYFTELYSNFAKNSNQNKTHTKWKTLELVIKDNQNPQDASITEQELTESIQSLKALLPDIEFIVTLLLETLLLLLTSTVAVTVVTSFLFWHIFRCVACISILHLPYNK